MAGTRCQHERLPLLSADHREIAMGEVERERSGNLWIVFPKHQDCMGPSIEFWNLLNIMLPLVSSLEK